MKRLSLTFTQLLFITALAAVTLGHKNLAYAETITLQEAVREAIAYSPDIKKAEAGVKAAEADTAKTRGALFPTVNAVGSANKANYQGANAPVTNGTNSNNGTNYVGELTLSQPLYAGGAITAGLDFYKKSEDLAHKNYFLVKQQLLYNVLNNFYALAQAQETLKASISNREVLKAYLDITTYYARIGRARKMDRMQAQVNLSLSLVDVEQGNNALKNAQYNLDKVLGVTKENLSVPEVLVKISSVEKLDQAYDEALKKNPTIGIAEITAEQIHDSRDIDLATDHPTAYLTAATGYQNSDSTQVFNSNSQFNSIGVTLTIPLFSGLSSLNKKEGYEQRYYEAERDLQNAKDTLHNQIQDSLATIASAVEQYNISQKAFKEGREALEIATDSYKHGVAASADVINIQTTRYNAEKTFVTSQFNYLQARLSLEQQLGEDLESLYKN